MHLQDKLAALFNVRPDEGQLITLVMLSAVFAFLADSFLVTAAYALFLTSFDTSAISYVYVGISLVGILASFLYLKASNRFGLMPTVLGSRLLLIVLLGVAWLLIKESTIWLLAVLPVLQGVYQSLANTAFWNINGRLFDIQQAKRLFGLIGASGTIGYMLGGILAPLFIAIWDTQNLLGVSLAAMVLSLAAGWRLHQRYTHLLHSPTDDTVDIQIPQPSARRERPLWQTPYVLQIIGGYLFFVIAYHFIEALFYSQAERVFPGEARLASFLAVFGAVVSFAGLLVETLGTSRFLTRFGVQGLVLLSPAVLMTLVALNAVVGLLTTTIIVIFAVVTLAYFAENILNALDYVAISVLYQPLPPAQRTTVQTLLDGAIGPAATGISGVLLLIVLELLGERALLPVLLPIMLAWLLLARRTARMYPQKLQQALRDRALQGVQRVNLDATGLAILQASLADPEPGPVIYALDTWQALQPEQLPSQFPALLAHPSPIVQLEVLHRIERLAVRPALPAVRRLAEQVEDPALRGAAWRVLIAVGGPPETLEELNTLLNAPEPEVQQGVMIGLLRSGELEGILAAGDLLSTLLRSARPEDRIFAARVLGESGLQSVYRPILRLLEDDQVQVQRAALRAAGQLDQPRLWPSVVACLERPLVRAAATSALVNGRKNVIPALQTALDSPTAQSNPAVMLRLARICGRLRLRELGERLLPLVDYPDDFVRTETVLALKAMGYRDNTDLSLTQIQIELSQAAWLLAALVDLAESNEPSVVAVQTAVTESLERLVLRLFGWLSLAYDPVTVSKAQDVLGLNRWSGGAVAPEQHAYALEMLDLTVDHKIFAALQPLLAEAAPAWQLAQLLPYFPQAQLTPTDRLGTIAGGSAGQFTPWLRSVALYARQMLSPKETELLTAAAADTNPLLRETAVWTMQQLSARAPKGESPMLVTIEKVMLLKVVDLFSETPDEILVEVAERLHELAVSAGTTIFERGERGESLYIIISGGVEVFNGDTILDRLGPRQLFGEMALLDAEPRAASVRTVAETRLLRLDQEAFYELMDDRIEIAYGVIHVIVKRLRMNMLEVARLQNQLSLQATQRE